MRNPSPCLFARRIFCALLFAILLSGCAGHRESSGGRSVSTARRLQIIDAVNATFAAMTGTDPVTQNQQLAAFMATQPEFEATGVTDDLCAWGRFTDGRLLIVANNRPVASAGRQIAPSNESRGTGIPESTSLRLYDAMGTYFSHPAAGFQTALASHGYDLAGGAIQRGRVQDLRQVQGEGVFYMDAHGGTGVSRSGHTLYSIWTGTPVTSDSESNYDVDLKSNKLVYMSAATDNAPNTALGHTVETHYAITPQFVSTYMHFGPSSLVIINACSSDNANFKSACLTAGAGAYAGWTQPVGDSNAFAAATFIFDRMLSTNTLFPTYDPAKPPFDLAELRAAMATEVSNTGSTYDTSPGTNRPDAKFIITAGSGDLDVIVPSVHEATVDLVKDEMTLTGIFGPDQGTVDVDGTLLSVGTPVQIKSWTATKIVTSTVPDALKVAVRSKGRTGNLFPLHAVRLDPQEAKIGSDSSTTFNAIVTGGGDIVYEWKTSGDHGHIEDTHGHSGKSFTSTDSSVTYKSDSNVPPDSADDVTVKASVVLGNVQNLIGTATSYVLIGGGEYVLSGDNGGPFVVDDNLTVWLNDEIIFNDARGAFAGPRGPFRFNAKPGDTVRIQVQDWYGFYSSIGNVNITTPGGETTQLIAGFQTQTPQGNHAILIDQTFTLP